MLDPNRKYLHRFVKIHPVLRKRGASRVCEILRNYDEKKVTNVGSSSIQTVLHQLFHGGAKIEHDLSRTDPMNGLAVDGLDGFGRLQAGAGGGTAERG